MVSISPATVITVNKQVVEAAAEKFTFSHRRTSGICNIKERRSYNLRNTF